MCDYSLMAIPNRLAVYGEELVCYRFGTGAKGFISSYDASVLLEPAATSKDFLARLWRLLRKQQCPAVCIPPGARLLMRNVPPTLLKKCGVTGEMQEVAFTQTSLDLRFRDALRFANGFELSLQKLNEGLRVRVLSLSSEEHTSPFMGEELPTPDLRPHVFGIL